MFELPKLPYGYEALEPYIDAKTMEIHYTKHHQAYVDKLNAALSNLPDWSTKPIDEILRKLDKVPQNVREAVRNNGGGHANHSLFWQVIGPQAESAPTDSLGKAIADKYGDFAVFQQKFADVALGRFGSGWAWLVAKSDSSLDIYSTANQDSPLSKGDTPIIGLDVWEHAYYLKYQNRRPDYVSAFWRIVNWDAAEQRFSALNG